MTKIITKMPNPQSLTTLVSRFSNYYYYYYYYYDNHGNVYWA